MCTASSWTNFSALPPSSPVRERETWREAERERERERVRKRERMRNA